VGERVAVNEQDIQTINGVGEGSIKKAVNDLKGDALKYNTLGKAEDAIQTLEENYTTLTQESGTLDILKQNLEG